MKLKKSIFAFIVLLLMCMTAVCALAWESPFGGKLGDVDSDEAITTTDARITLRFAARLETPTDEQRDIADVDGDNDITTTDARRILRVAANLEIIVPTTEPPATEPPATEPPATEPPATDPADIILPENSMRTVNNDNGYGIESRKMCCVKTAYAETLPIESVATNKSNPLYTPQLIGMYDYILGTVSCVSDGETHTFYNLASGRRVYVDDVSVIEPGAYALGPNVARLSKKVLSGKSTDIFFSLDWAVPFNVVLAPQNYVTGYNSRPWNIANGQLTAEYIDITFSYTQSAEGLLSFPRSGVVSSAQWVEDWNADTSTLRLYLRKAGVFYGYHAYYDDAGHLVFSIKEHPWVSTGITVLLDPGHGGYDGGAVSLGVRESSVTLAIAQRLKPKLEAAGITVIMTHNGIAGNSVMKLDERTELIRKYNPDLAISLHCDSVDSKTVNGVAVYYYKNYSYGFAADLQYSLVEAYNSRLGYNVANKGVMFYPFYVTRVEECPSVLIEYGYLSNTISTRKLSRNTAVCPYSEPSSSVSQGDSGDAVRWVQWYLVQLGYSVGSAGIDGDFGSSTYSSVCAFQSARGLTVDGVVGPATRAELIAAYSGAEAPVSSGKTEHLILTSAEGQEALAEGTAAGILRFLARY